MPQIAPYGTWTSPLDASAVAEAGIRLGQVRAGEAGLYWEEMRPAEGGRTVLVHRARDGSVSDVTPDGFNVRTQVHEYGGGSCCLHTDTVFFSNWTDQRLYRQGPGAGPVAITPEPDAPRGLRYADGVVTADGSTIVCVRERHAGEVVNEIVAVPTDGSHEPEVLVGGHDFFSTPRLSPDGSRLAWLAWDHPNMPWDGTRLYVGRFDGSAVTDVVEVAGGDRVSVFQPTWSPDGVLHFVADPTGWWNLHRLGADGAAEVLHDVQAEFGLPQWQFAMSTFAFLDDDSIACSFVQDGSTRLGVLGPDGLRVITDDLVIGASVAVSDGRIAVVAATARESSAVMLIDADSGGREVVRRPSKLDIEDASVSVAEPIAFPTSGRQTAHAFFYAPRSATCTGPGDDRPPLLVFTHGGPTGSVSPSLNASIQFWTTRGFAVVDVNYGGSTGYGRAYRERLEGNWGIVDVQDCVAAVRYLVERGDVDPDRVAIRGGSAGGFTTLAALAFTEGVFRAGANYYGVSDLAGLAADTHKFESRYLDSLVGPYPQRKDLYEARAPVEHADRITCPVVTFQGLEDAIVPPSQSERIVEALRSRAIPCAYVTYEGEQHGFRKAENVAHSLGAELSFYGQVFGFEPAGDGPVLQVENLR